MSRRYDLLGASQTRFARDLRRASNDEHAYIIRQRRIPRERAPGPFFRALAHAERWLWDSGGARLSKRATILAIGAIMTVAATHFIAHHLFTH